MTTQDYEDLMLYWSGELDESSQERVARRLESDPEAVAYLASLEELQTDFKQLEPPSLPRALAQETVSRELASEKVLPMQPRRHFHWLGTVAALLVIGFTAFMLMPKQQSEVTKKPASSENVSPEVVTPPATPKALSKRLFVAKSRFGRTERIRETKERTRKIRSRLNHYSI